MGSKQPVSEVVLPSNPWQAGAAFVDHGGHRLYVKPASGTGPDSGYSAFVDGTKIGVFSCAEVAKIKAVQAAAQRP